MKAHTITIQITQNATIIYCEITRMVGACALVARHPLETGPTLTDLAHRALAPLTLFHCFCHWRLNARMLTLMLAPLQHCSRAPQTTLYSLLTPLPSFSIAHTVLTALFSICRKINTCVASEVQHASPKLTIEQELCKRWRGFFISLTKTTYTLTFLLAPSFSSSFF